MAYADQEMSGNKIIAIIIVALIHIGIGYVLITGLAYSAVQSVVERVTTVDIDEPPPPEEEPPPPPEEVPETVPPPFVPPPQINVRQDAPTQRSDTQIRDNTEVQRQPTTKQCPDGSTVAVTAQCGPAVTRCPDGTTVRQGTACPEPKPRIQPKPATPKNNPGGWITNSDYRSSWIRRDYAGTVSFNLSVGSDGRVSGCSVTGGSAPQDLKDASCSLIQRRARFNAATDGEGRATTGSYSNTVRWQIPE
uniref:energy transducer TonB n=1 Tax=Parerythrobacter lutipelagi TaxID=1964208 RepID=UPI0018641B0F|nr:energy transducer TonB [Parerythrobacter lutipelagi]